MVRVGGVELSDGDVSWDGVGDGWDGDNGRRGIVATVAVVTGGYKWLRAGVRS